MHDDGKNSQFHQKPRLYSDKIEKKRKKCKRFGRFNGRVEFFFVSLPNKRIIWIYAENCHHHSNYHLVPYLHPLYQGYDGE